MQIIPVLDIRGGQVVHAKGGERANYQPWQSCLTQATTPMEVMRDLLNWYAFPVVYIADLDAIEGGRRDVKLITQLLDQFPEVVIWLDAGIATVADAQHYRHLPQLRLILGSETLLEAEVLHLNEHRPPLLSLDKKNGQLLTKMDVLACKHDWPDEIIAMQIDAVGKDAGPAFSWIAEIRQLKPDAQIYAAGGVRNDADLQALKNKGVAGVLLASALHHNRLSKQSIAAIMQ